MLDVQSQLPKHMTAINQVGILDLLILIKVASNNKVINTNAHFSFSGSLRKNNRGTHMSRFVLILHEFQDQLFNYDKLAKISNEAKKRLGTKCSVISLNFDYFIQKQSPITKFNNLVSYKASMSVINNRNTRVFLKIMAPITSVCPCSKEISNKGAHNQRGEVTIEAEITNNKQLWFPDLITVAESAASAEIYSILKREDEKYVTEKAYRNAVFVEDIVREINKRLKALKIENYTIFCKNYESIHNHNVFAKIEKGEILT